MARADGVDRGTFERARGSKQQIERAQEKLQAAEAAGDPVAVKKMQQRLRHLHTKDWWVAYADHTGRERREKAGTKSVAIALYRRRKEEVARGQKIGPLTQRALTVADLVDNYFEEMTSGKKPKGVTAYQVHADFWRSALGSELAEELEPGQVEKWKAKLLKSAKPATVNRKLTFLRRVYSLAVRDRKVKSSPMGDGRVRQLRENNRRDRFFSRPEAATMEGAFPRDLWLLVGFALLTGLRQGEQLALRREDVRLEQKLLRLPGPQQAGPDTKGQEEQFVRLNAASVAILEAQLASHGHDLVFPGPRGGLMDGCALNRRFQRWLNKLGVAAASWHTLRHTFISWLVMLAIPLPTVQKLARHKTIEMTLRYAHLCPTHEQESIEQLGLSLAAGNEPVRKPAPTLRGWATTLVLTGSREGQLIAS